MAKKTDALSLEEKLEQALVPEGEQPYTLPENWVWTKWGFCGIFIAGNSFKPEFQGFTEYMIPFYKVGSLKHSYSDGYLYDTTNTVSEKIRETLKAALIPTNSLIFAKIGEAIRLNRRSLNMQPCCIDNNLMAFISNITQYKYVYYWSLFQEFYKITNATTVPAIRKSDLEQLPFPLPPLAEQQRIVDRIESLFEKLDAAKELAQSVLDTFETRKVAILHQAFTGELTKQWREENHIHIEGWTMRAIHQLVRAIKDKFDPVNDTSSIPYIGLEHLAKGNGIIATGSSAELKSLKTLFQAGDILYGKLRPYLNKHDVAGFAGMCSTDILVFRANDCTEAKYINYVMDTSAFMEYAVSRSKGINLPRVSEKEIFQYRMRIPSLPEQQEIVRILDTLLEKEQAAKSACDILDKIDLMKKAILARAFRGELGTNDPAEESAIELLKETLMQA